jgi:beta-mannosidase
MNDCLRLPLRQGGGEGRALGGWEALWTSLGEGEAERLPAGRGTGWAPVPVPQQLAAFEGRSAVWYRTSFPRPDHGGRVLVRFGGAFLATNAWLNGRFLGSHYGYFGPFGFDLTPHLGDSNLLVVCCESPVETDLTRKRHVLGIFSDGDSRPYPDSAFFSLPDEYRWEVPVGLWRPVELEYTGAVLVDRLLLRPRFEAGVGRLEAETTLRNLDGRDMEVEATLQVLGERPLQLRRRLRIPGGYEQPLEFALSLPEAERWWPWRLGEAPLAQAVFEVTAGGKPSARVEETFGCRQLEFDTTPGAWRLRVNGQPLYLRGANYTPGYRLDQLTPESFRRDLELAKAANLDALRVHGHVLPPEFYREADAAGMLVLADFPLTGAYAYHASADEAAFFETSVREQLPEMVDLLGSRPSIIGWVAHDDPPWIPAQAGLGDVHTVRQNYTVDQEASATLERLDPSRPALASSGERDAHVYAGWRDGPWTDFQELATPLLSEFGAQALPDSRSEVWQSLPRGVREVDEDPSWLYAGFQPANWVEHGVGLPSQHPTLESYVQAGQRYQAQLVSFAVDQARRRKFEPTWGLFVYQLVDPFPGIGFGVLDHGRRPKLAYAALKQALAPSRVILEPTGYTPLEPFGFGYRPGAPLAVRLWVVNDDPGAAGEAAVHWRLRRVRAPELERADRWRDAVRRKSYAGAAELELPGLAEPALQCGLISLTLEAEGGYELEAQLVAGGEVLSTSVLELLVAERLPAPRRRPRMPAYIARGLVEPGSLQLDPAGVSLTLLNRLRPAVLTFLGEVVLEDSALGDVPITVDSGAGQVPLPRRLELPVGRPIRVHIECRPPADTERLTLALEVPGIARGRASVETRGSLTPERRLPY